MSEPAAEAAEAVPAGPVLSAPTQAVQAAPLLEAAGLVKVFPPRGGQPARKVVQGVDLQVSPGEVYGLMGLTAAGKSTLVGMLAGLLLPTAGSIRVNGAEAGPRQVRDSVALALGTDHGFYDRLTVEDNLRFFGVLLGLEPAAAREKSREVIEMVGLQRAADHAFLRLSSGQRRQIHLARALLVKRPLLIADEPTRGLDPATEERIVKLLTRVKKTGQTMLLVTHDVHLASMLCDRIGILESGQIIREGTPLELIHLLSATRIFIRFHEKPWKCVKRFREMPWLTELHTHDFDVHLYTHDPEHDINDVVKILVDVGTPVADIDVPMPGLEEVFLKLVAERKHQQQAKEAGAD
ncbi:MAG TPA: ABC transporter ATP-binding protein [Candidatus Acidoferrales bacterium]|nr:ABC transporter ATP-binding protein [Candidatus Acidoferrales bacterium]